MSAGGPHRSLPSPPPESTQTDSPTPALSRKCPRCRDRGSTAADVPMSSPNTGSPHCAGRTVQERVSRTHPGGSPDFVKTSSSAPVPSIWSPPSCRSPPAKGGHHLSCARAKFACATAQLYHLRPLHPADDRRLQAFFYSPRRRRSTGATDSPSPGCPRERACELVGSIKTADLALAILELRGTRQIIHAVGRYYLDTDETSAEMAFRRKRGETPCRHGPPTPRKTW